MNYIREINAFMDWLETNPLEATTQTLWFHIMAIANKSGWPEWFTIANLTLMARANISENTLIKHRNILIQKGRIQYKNQGKQKAGKYKLISFTSNNEVKHSVKDSVTSNNEVKHEVNHEVNHEVKCEVKPSALYKLNETKLNETIEEDRGAPSAASAAVLYDDRFRSIVEAYEANIRPITPLEAERLSKWLDDMDADVIIAAIEEAIVYNKRSMKYIEGILRNWHSNNIRTKLDLEAYRRDWEDRKQSEGQASRDLNKTVDFARFEHHEYTGEQLESLFEEIG